MPTTDHPPEGKLAAGLDVLADMAPRVHASGGRVRYGSVRSDVNRYLKWAYAEAANAIVIHRCKHPKRHVCSLYEGVRRRSGLNELLSTLSDSIRVN